MCYSKCIINGAPVYDCHSTVAQANAAGFTQDDNNRPSPYHILHPVHGAPAQYNNITGETIWGAGVWTPANAKVWWRQQHWAGGNDWKLCVPWPCEFQLNTKPYRYPPFVYSHIFKHDCLLTFSLLPLTTGKLPLYFGDFQINPKVVVTDELITNVKNEVDEAAAALGERLPTSSFQFEPLTKETLTALHTLYYDLMQLHNAAKSSRVGTYTSSSPPGFYDMDGNPIDISNIKVGMYVYCGVANYGLRGDRALDSKHIVFVYSRNIIRQFPNGANVIVLHADLISFFASNDHRSRTPNTPADRQLLKGSAAAFARYAWDSKIPMLQVQGGDGTSALQEAFLNRNFTARGSVTGLVAPCAKLVLESCGLPPDASMRILSTAECKIFDRPASENGQWHSLALVSQYHATSHLFLGIAYKPVAGHPLSVVAQLVNACSALALSATLQRRSNRDFDLVNAISMLPVVNHTISEAEMSSSLFGIGMGGYFGKNWQVAEGSTTDFIAALAAGDEDTLSRACIAVAASAKAYAGTTAAALLPRRASARVSDFFAALAAGDEDTLSRACIAVAASAKAHAGSTATALLSRRASARVSDFLAALAAGDEDTLSRAYIAIAISAKSHAKEYSRAFLPKRAFSRVSDFTIALAAGDVSAVSRACIAIASKQILGTHRANNYLSILATKGKENLRRNTSIYWPQFDAEGFVDGIQEGHSVWLCQCGVMGAFGVDKNGTVRVQKALTHLKDAHFKY